MKKSDLVPIEGCTEDAILLQRFGQWNSSCFSRSVKACIKMKNYYLLLLSFSYFIYHSEFAFLSCPNGTLSQLFRKNKRSFTSCIYIFYRIWLVLEDPYSRLMFYFGLINIDLRSPWAFVKLCGNQSEHSFTDKYLTRSHIFFFMCQRPQQ